MARGGSRGRRSYVRDSNGRFASTPGGGASRKAKPSPGFRRSQQVKLAKQRGQTGRLGSATKEARARLKASKAKLTPGASRQQRAAVTRAQRTVAALAGQRRIAGARPAGVLRGPAAGKVRRASGARVRDIRGDGMSRGRPGQLARAAARAEANLQRLAGPAMRQQTESGRSKPETGYAVSQYAVDLYSGKARSTGRALNRLPVSLSFDRGKKVVARRMSDAEIGAKSSRGGSKRKGVTGSGVRTAAPVVDATPMGRPQQQVPASQRPGSITSTLRSTLQSLAKADAARIREVEAITGQKVRAPRKPPAGSGATVRAPGRGSVTGTLGDNLRSLAQSDARYIRELDALTRPGASGALPGSSGGRRRVSGGKSGAKALPPAPAPEPKPKPAPRSRKKAEGPVAPVAPPKVLPRGQRRRVRGPSSRPAGTIAKPKGWKPGTLAERRARGSAALANGLPYAREKSASRLQRYDETQQKLRNALLAGGQDGSTKVTRAREGTLIARMQRLRKWYADNWTWTDLKQVRGGLTIKSRR